MTIIGDKGIILELKCVTPKALENAGVKDNDRAKIKAMMATKLDEAVKQTMTMNMLKPSWMMNRPLEVCWHTPFVSAVNSVW